MKGKLVLIPTPIDDESPLEPIALALLEKAVMDKESYIAVEDAKPGRRRWLHWGLPREAIEDFILYNEHTRVEQLKYIMQILNNGATVFLMSDAGLPAFCDPGRDLVEACHIHNIKVTATPFCNSISLALSLSGMNHDKFMFNGFLPAKTEARALALKEILRQKTTQIIMDTPYRLSKTLDEIVEINGKSEIFLAMNLNHPEELLLRGTARKIAKQVKGKKAEFILVISQ